MNTSDLMNKYKQAAREDIETAALNIREPEGLQETAAKPFESPRERITRHVQSGLYKGRQPKLSAISKKVPGQSPHFSLPTFTLAGDEDPTITASNIAKSLGKEDFVESSVAAGPYVNIVLNNEEIVRVATELARREQSASPPSRQVYIVDFSSPNIAKQFGINHLRPTIVGDSICKLLEACGHTVVGVNHLGDLGSQFGLISAAYDILGHDKMFNELDLQEINELYIEASKQNTPIGRRIKHESRSYFEDLTNEESEQVTRWAHIVELSREHLDEFYDLLGVEFDITVGEAFFQKRSVVLVDQMTSDETLSLDAGGTAYTTTEEDQHVIFRNGHGHTLYAARDLAAIEQRTTDFDPDNIIYVVGSEQTGHFEAVFRLALKSGLASRLGTNKNVILEHLPLGMLLGQDGTKLSTRRGTSGVAHDLYLDVLKAVKTRQTDRGSVGDKEAKLIALAILKWEMLESSPAKAKKFNYEVAESNNGVFKVLYSYVRSTKLLQDNQEIVAENKPCATITDAEKELVVLLSEVEHRIGLAAEQRDPKQICDYLLELANLHGTFYKESNVSSPKVTTEERAFRLTVHKAFTNVAAQALGTLNITPPTKM